MDANEIKEIRQQMELTQVEMAHHLGLCIRTIKSWEAGELPLSNPAFILLRLMKVKGKHWVDQNWRKFL